MLPNTILHCSTSVSLAPISLLPNYPSRHPLKLPTYDSSLAIYTSPNTSTVPKHILDPFSDTTAICLTNTSYVPELSAQATDQSTALQAFRTKLLCNFLPT